jgi:hypothetical protein
MTRLKEYIRAIKEVYTVIIQNIIYNNIGCVALYL